MTNLTAYAQQWISGNGKEVIQGLVAAAVWSAIAWVSSRILHYFTQKHTNPATHNPSLAGRNVTGYVFGWVITVIFVPTFEYFTKGFSQGDLSTLILISSTTIPMIGWLDRYNNIRSMFGGSSVFLSAMFSVFSFLASASLVAVISGVVLLFLKLLSA